MIANKKACPAVAAAGQAVENKGATAFSPLCDSITDTAREQGLVESVLPCGEENAIRAARLVSILGLKSCRVLRLMVNQERENGALILSGDSGYYMPSPGIVGQQEMRAFVTRMEATALNTRKAAKAVRNALQSVEGQTVMSGFDNGRGY